MAVHLGELTKPKTYQAQVWLAGSGSNTTWETITVTAESFAIDNGVLKFTLRGALIRACAENTWQQVWEA
jgi:hypothetical protein